MATDSGAVPVVSFRQVAGNEYAAAPADVPPAIRSYGYNNPDEEFQRPEHYMRYIGVCRGLPLTWGRAPAE